MIASGTRATARNVLRVVVTGMVVACVWQSASSASAARLLTATVTVNSQEVFASAYQDNGRAGAAEVWSYLGQPPIFVDHTPPVVADSIDPLQTTLEGDVVIRVQQSDHVIVEAKTNALTLVRNDTDSEKWFLAADDVQRLAQQLGIAHEPVSTSWDQAVVLPLALLIGVAIAGVCVWALLRMRRACSTEPRS